MTTASAAIVPSTSVRPVLMVVVPSFSVRWSNNWGCDFDVGQRDVALDGVGPGNDDAGTMRGYASDHKGNAACL